MKPVFMTFEGIDGCGKSSLIKTVAGKLRRAGCKVTLTREPTGTWLGEAVRRSYKERVSPYTEAFLFLADRATHTDRIRADLRKGRTVLSDRYTDSTVAYQAAYLHQRLGGECSEYIEWLRAVSAPAIIPPDITFLLDVDPRVSLDRLRGRSEMEKFETLKNLKMVRSNYLAIAGSEDRIVVIDASKSMPEVRDEVLGILEGRLRVKL